MILFDERTRSLKKNIDFVPLESFTNKFSTQIHWKEQLSNENSDFMKMILFQDLFVNNLEQMKVQLKNNK